MDSLRFGATGAGEFDLSAEFGDKAVGEVCSLGLAAITGLPPLLPWGVFTLANEKLFRIGDVWSTLGLNSVAPWSLTCDATLKVPQAPVGLVGDGGMGELLIFRYLLLLVMLPSGVAV